MGDSPITKSGFIVCRRCDACGTRMSTITFDDGNKCTLKCTRCNKEYHYFVKRIGSDEDYAWIHLAGNFG